MCVSRGSGDGGWSLTTPAQASVQQPSKYVLASSRAHSEPSGSGLRGRGQHRPKEVRRRVGGAWLPAPGPRGGLRTGMFCIRSCFCKEDLDGSV